MKTLRLILWRDCPRACSTCPNKSIECGSVKPFFFNEDLSGYDEIILTGGEPLMRPGLLRTVAEEIKRQTDAKVYVYSAWDGDLSFIADTLSYVDGITLSLYTWRDVSRIPELTELIKAKGLDTRSLRINSFLAPVDADPEIWKVKYKTYLKDCPIPDHEELREISWF